MIKLENTQVVGWEPAIRGMRNPMNSWDKSDTGWKNTPEEYADNNPVWEAPHFEIGPNDHDLMMRLAANGPVHAKYRRMIEVYVDITAPLYWWKEFDTYKVGTVANSCSTMHKIQAKEFTREDFSCEQLSQVYAEGNKGIVKWPKIGNLSQLNVLDITIEALNANRKAFLETGEKFYWWQMIQLLPSSYNQKRTVMLSYEVLAHIYPDRKNHKLDEWHDFCSWATSLPYSELITLDKNT